MGPFAAVGLMTFALLATRVATAWLIMPLLAQARWGASAGEVGLILTAGALATSATLPVVPRLSRKFGRGTAIAGSTAMVLAGLWFVGTAATIVGMTFGSLLLGIANALGIPALSAYAVDLTPPGRLGAAMGLLRMATDGGVVFGPIVLGLMVDQLGLGYGGALVWAGAWLLACNTAFAAAMRGHKAPRG